MPRIIILVLSLLLLVGTVSSFAGRATDAAGQTIITVVPKPGTKAPQVVIYTMSTCTHCREAKAYLTSNNIPFIVREVDTDDEHMATLMGIYDSMGVPEQKRGVPLLVIGNRIRIQGFNKDKLQDALKEVTSDPK